jgi:2-dehydro-3-deoxyphosphogluconate aldolase/(4S)-4-hydroxy-2-oxoglutarate aldolase
VSRGTVMAAIAEQRVVPVLRCADWRDAVETVSACARAGCRAVELTMSTPEVERAVAALAGDDVLIGVGTIAAPRTVVEMAAAGAAFVVSFCRPEGFVAAAHRAGLAAIPGAATPSEIQACIDDGADAVKLFPARLLTPSFLRDVRPLFPGLRVMATGGVAATSQSLGPWLNAGAFAVGVGSDLGTVAADGPDEVERRCAAALSAARATGATTVVEPA